MESRRGLRPRITDVADLAGVSVASVSRVLNESAVVADVTRAKVLDAVRDLGFSIDQRARALSRQRSETIGVIVADVSNPFTAQVLKGIEIVARENSYGLFLSDSGEDAERERKNLDAMLAQRIDGIVILPVTLHGVAFRPLVAQGIPIVCLDRYVDDLELDTVVVDNVAAGAIAADTFLDARHTMPGSITVGSTTVGRDRLAGFEGEALRRGHPVDPAFVRTGNWTIESGYEQARILFTEVHAPTALFVQNDPMTLGVLSALREIGLRVPRDVSVIAFDDAPHAHLLEPALTTLRQPTNELGSAAAEMLLDRVARGYTAAARRLVLAPELIERASTGAPPARAGKKAAR